MKTAENEQDNTELEVDNDTQLTAEELAAQQALADKGTDDDDGDDVITLGDVPPPGASDEEDDETAPAWVK